MPRSPCPVEEAGEGGGSDAEAVSRPSVPGSVLCSCLALVWHTEESVHGGAVPVFLCRLLFNFNYTLILQSTSAIV